MERIKEFTESFFRNLKCGVSWNNEVLVVSNVPRGFEDLFGEKSPYMLTFISPKSGEHFVGKGSQMLGIMNKYLEGAGKATILRIDFEIDPESEIRKRMALRNCEIESLTKGYRNSFFSRFSFLTSFNYLNESERVLSEVYVHDGEVVDGDLSGYTVVDGDKLEVDGEKVKRDYKIAQVRAIELSSRKQEEVGGVLKEKAEAEVERIRGHYDKQLKEFGGDLNGKLGKIREVELELRGCDEGEKGGVRKRLERLRLGIVKSGDDEAVQRVLKEREMTIGDVMQKYSLNVDRKLANTTVIYYPCYVFKLHLKNNKVAGRRPQAAGRVLEVSYNPLTKSFSGLDCEVCEKRLDRVSFCESGHICCENCLDRCGECGGIFCDKCLKRSCKACGRKLCKSCVKMCFACGGVVCATHLRKDCVSGEERCVSCLRACMRCHGMTMEKHFGEALDGSKVCEKCLGAERSGKVLERVFDR